MPLAKEKKKERKKFPQKRDLASCDINSTALFFFLLVWLHMGPPASHFGKPLLRRS